MLILRHFRCRLPGRGVPAMVAMVAMCLGLADRLAADGGPNVIFVVADDLNMRVETHGHPDARTPNMLRLAAKGVTFRRAYSQFPACGPSRSSFFMGMHPWRLGVSLSTQTLGPLQLFPNHPMVQQHFAQQGYRTVGIGKLNHFQRSAAWQQHIPRTAPENFNGPPVVKETYSNPNNTGGTTLYTWDLPDERFTDGVVAEHAVRELRSLAQGDQPFFLGVGFSMPHTPWKIPHDLWRAFDPDEITLPDEPPESYSTWWNFPYYHDRNFPLPDVTNRRKAFAASDAAIHFMDRQLGKILDVIDEEELWENTVVVFFSDHGFSMGEHRYFWSKTNITNEALQVPLLIAAPGGAQGGECWAGAQLVDLYRTLIDLCGLPAWDGRIALDGRSLATGVADPAALPDAPAFSSMATQSWFAGSPLRPNHRVVHFGGWKLVEGSRYTTGEVFFHRLFDHNTDVTEYYHIADETKRAEMAALFPSNMDLTLKSYWGAYQPVAQVLPDRDRDGMSDEIELSLETLGLDYLTPQPELAPLLAHFAPYHIGGTTAGSTIVAPDGPRFRLQLYETSDLRGWAPTRREPRFLGNGVVEWPPVPGQSGSAFFRLRTDVAPGS